MSGFCLACGGASTQHAADCQRRPPQELFAAPLQELSARRTPEYLAFEACIAALEGLSADAQFRVIHATCILLHLDKRLGI